MSRVTICLILIYYKAMGIHFAYYSEGNRCLCLFQTQPTVPGFSFVKLSKKKKHHPITVVLPQKNSYSQFT